MSPDYDETPEEVETEPAVVKGWSLEPSTLMWIALGVLAIGFGIYFLVTFTGERALAIKEAVTNDGATE